MNKELVEKFFELIPDVVTYSKAQSLATACYSVINLQMHNKVQKFIKQKTVYYMNPSYRALRSAHAKANKLNKNI